MSDRAVCETCGVELIGERCLNRECEDRHESVDDVLDGDEEVRVNYKGPVKGESNDE